MTQGSPEAADGFILHPLSFIHYTNHWPLTTIHTMTQQPTLRAGMIGILVPHWPPSAAARAAAHTVVPSLHDASEVISLLLAPAGLTH